MGRIGIGEEKAHGDGLDAVGLELADSVRDVVGIQRLDHLALGA